MTSAHDPGRMAARTGAWAVRAARVALAVALGAAASGCSSGGPGTFERIGGLVKNAVAPPEPAAPRERTRAELNEIPYATIGVSFGQGMAYLVPLANNGGYLDYRDAAGRSIRMHDGAVVATEGVGVDLEAVRFGTDDPIANQMPLAEWPERIFREYQYQWRHGPQYGITLACTYQQVASETIEIVELTFDVIRVVETCTNQARQVVNTYWVEADTGFIWRSDQWLGPAIGAVTVDIIRPFGG
jgi:hypothetical protein